MPSRVHAVRDPAQIAALAAPLRASLLDLVERRGPSAVRELAEQLGVQPDTLHYHVRRLVEIGLLEQVGTRPTKRHDEALYDLAHPRGAIVHEPSDPDNAEALTKLSKTILAHAGQDFREGLASPRARGNKGARNLWAQRLEADLSHAELRELEGHLAAIEQLLRKPRRVRARGRKLVALSWLLAPIELEAGRRRSKRAQRP